MSLNTIGIFYGTDKSSLRNDYLRHYEALFSRWQNESFNFIEIGIHKGASLRMWQSYFLKATIVGVDIEARCRRFAGGRVHVEIGSQDDEEFLSSLAKKFPPTCVIDDGSHVPEHQIFSFEQLFPALKPGGCYVVEDLSGEPSARHGGISAISYFGSLQQQLISESPWTIARRIERIDVFPRAIAIWKPSEVDHSIDLSWIDDLVRRSGNVDSFLYFSEYLDRRVGALDRALVIARQGAEMAPEEPWFRVRIAEILKKKGDIEGAIAAANEALRLRPDIRFFGQYVQELISHKS